MPGQRQETGRTVGVTAPAGPVRGLFRPRPWPVPPPSVARTAPGTRRPRTPSRAAALRAVRWAEVPGLVDVILLRDGRM